MTQCNTGITVGVIASILVAVGLGATLYVTTTGSGTGGNTTTTTTNPSTTTGNPYLTPCGLCGPEIDVALSVVNSLVEPYFNHSVELYGMRQRELIFFLENAAKKQREFRFAGNYHEKWGFFIDTINGLKADFNLNKTWWKITDQDMVSLTLGVSSYVPQHQETLIFTFVQSDGH
ncbi:uncharacterized protein [Haliotis cracherodii]|uniref:uncharacterized protein n=1 Tax=Haliotis cracherodii TaxID=6455 RepID=UPI0039ED4F2D